MKICAKCKHAERGIQTICVDVIRFHVGEYPFCLHPEAKRELVHGKSDERCWYSRQSGHCGADGKNWEEYVDPPRILIQQPEPPKEETKKLHWFKRMFGG